MVDSIFGKLENDGDCLIGRASLDFGGTVYPIEVMIQIDEKEAEITEYQYQSYQMFMEKWSDIQAELIEALIEYYNEKERFAWGLDDEEETLKWWTEIETPEALLDEVTIETIVIPEDFMEDVKGGRYIYLLFARKWGGEDLDDNGIGVGFLDEKIDEIAYKDIAY